MSSECGVRLSQSGRTTAGKLGGIRDFVVNICSRNCSPVTYCVTESLRLPAGGSLPPDAALLRPAAEPLWSSLEPPGAPLGTAAGVTLAIHRPATVRTRELPILPTSKLKSLGSLQGPTWSGPLPVPAAALLASCFSQASQAGSHPGPSLPMSFCVSPELPPCSDVKGAKKTPPQS